MQEIDFLPQRYREASAQRSRKTWGGLVVVLYALLLCTSGYLQKSGQKRLKQELAAAQEQQAMVTAQTARLAAFEMDLKRAESQASLIVYLRHPWPRTQLLAAGAEPLIEGLTLAELRVHRLESLQTSVRIAAPRQPTATGTDAKPDDRSPAQRDLEQLRGHYDNAAVAVSLKGSAEDVSLVHMYLGRLGKDPLFARVDLMSIDGQQELLGQNKGCRFTARLVLRPGYGQVDGPTVPLPAVAHASLREVLP
jgi:hypothetical protein